MIKGCLMGTALADALGAYTEFRSGTQLRKWFPKNSDFKFPPEKDTAEVLLRHFGHRTNDCHWTDDTSQMILLIQMLIETKNKIDHTIFANKLYDWLDHGIPECNETEAFDCGGLTLCVIRGPNFRTNPIESAKSRWSERGGTVAPNGSLMRNSIMACRGLDYISTIKEAVAIGNTTHYDTRCDASIAIITSIIWDILNGTDDDKILKRACLWCGLANEYEDECKTYFNVIDITTIDLLDTMGYVLKCMAVGVWAFRQKHRGYKEVILDIILAGGDTDTNGAVAGGILGAYYGIDNLPTDWVNEMPYTKWFSGLINNYIGLL